MPWMTAKQHALSQTDSIASMRPRLIAVDDNRTEGRYTSDPELQ